MRTTMTVPEIAMRLGICEETVYEMLRDQVIPNIRYGRRFIISRLAYEKWESTIGEAVPIPNKEPKSVKVNSASGKTRSAKAA